MARPLFPASQALYQLSYAPEGGVRLAAGGRVAGLLEVASDVTDLGGIALSLKGAASQVGGEGSPPTSEPGPPVGVRRAVDLPVRS